MNATARQNGPRSPVRGAGGGPEHKAADDREEAERTRPDVAADELAGEVGAAFDPGGAGVERAGVVRHAEDQEALGEGEVVGAP